MHAKWGDYLGNFGSAEGLAGVGDEREGWGSILRELFWNSQI